MRYLSGAKLAFVVGISVFAMNCSGKTYSTFFQPFDLVFGSQNGQPPANPAVSGSLIAATPLTNTRVMLTFSKPVTLASGQNVANYRITAANGNLLNILAVSRDPNNSNIIFVDTIPQAAGTQYTATVSGITFVDGAALGNARATFTAPTNADQTAPEFGSAAALTSTTVEVYFNEAISQTNPATGVVYSNATFGSFFDIYTNANCTGTNVNVTSAVRDAANFAKVTLTAPTGLVPGGTYYVCATTDVRDVWGNSKTTIINNGGVIASSAFLFTAPTPRVASVTSTSPSTVLVTYSEDMDTTGIAGTALTNNANYTINQCSTAGSVNLNSVGTVVGTRSVLFTGVTSTGNGSCHLTVTIPGGTTCDTTAGLVCSAAGARLTTAGNTGVLSYNNSNATDTTPPAVVGVTTTNSNTVVVTFSEPVTGVTTGDFNFSPALNITNVSCSVNVCTLTTDDQSSTPYSVSITSTSGGIQDNATPANTLSSGSTTFNGDGKPYIVAIYAIDSGTVMVQWSEPIGGSGTVNAADYSLDGTALDQAPWSPGSSAALHLPDANDRSIYVKLTIAPVLTDGTTHTIGVNNPTGSTDASGNPTLGTVPNGGAFTGPSATVAPQVTSATSTSPTTVIVIFNEPLNNATIAAGDFALTGANCPTGATSAIQIAAGVVQLVVTPPGAPAAAVVSCTVTVGTGNVADLAGNTIGATNNNALYDYSGTNVATPDTTAPTVASVVAFSNTEVRVYFSEIVTSGSGQNLANYSFSPALSGGINNISCSGTVCTITLNAPGTSAVQYALTVSGVQDAVPNTMATQTVNFSGIGSSATAPTLFLATLINSTTVELSFSEAMNLGTAQTASNYLVTGGNTVSSAVIQTDTTKVRLTITPGAYGSSNSYTVTATGVTDAAGNTIGTPNTATFSGSGTAPSTASLATVSDTGTVGDNITGVNLTSPGLQFTGNTTPNTTVILYHSPGVSFTDAGDLVTLTSHGLANGTAVSFTTINSTTGIATNTTYYVINATANTFQLSTTPGGAVAPLTTDGTGILNTPIPYATAVSGPTGTYTVTVPSTATISQGTNQFNIATVGSTGLVSDLSQTFSINYDSTNPIQPTSLTLVTASDTGISNSDRITNGASLQFSVNCEAGATVVLRNGATDISSPVGGATCPIGGNVTLTTTALAGSGQTGTAYPSINVIQTDVAGNVSTASANLSVTVDSTAPGLTSSNLASNTTLTLNLNENAYNVSGGALTAAAFSLSFAANAGTATGASITGITHTAGSNTVTLTISVTGTVAGTETITVDTVANSVYDNAGNASTFSTGAKTLSAIGIANITNTPTYVAIAPVSGGTTGYIDLVWSEGVYTNAGATGSLVASDFSVAFVQNSGNSTNAIISCVTTAPSTVCPGTAPAGGATAMRLIVTGTGVTSGVETIQVTAATGEIHSGTNGITPNTVGTSVLTFPDRLAPTITSVNSSTADGNYKAGDVISIQVNFSENVTVTGTPQLTLETGATDAVVNYASGSGTSTLTFTYTVASPHTSTDLNANSLALNSGTINDAASNAANLTLSGTTLAANKNLVVDTTAPTITSLNSSTANGSYKAGDAISIQVNFSENVTVTGTPQLTLETGATDAVVNYVSGSGTNSLTFTYTVASPHTSSDLDANSLALSGGTINDAAGNAAALALAGTSLATNKNLVVDTTLPTITSVNSSTANGSYKAGDVISIQVNFSENVTVTGTPQLILETGATDAVVNYVSGSGTGSLTFTYTVASPHTSSDLDANSLGLNGGTINDAAGNAATLTLAGTTLATNKNLVVDTTVPTITSVNSSTANGTYKIGDIISIQVNFSENVTVTGTPQLTLETGATDAVVNYASGSGTSSLTFTYTIASPHVSADLDANSLALNGGTINDGAANAATLTLAGTTLATNKNLVVDGVAPTITSVNSSTADGSYKTGDVISIQVNFSENVTVTGTPQLTLETGATDAVVNYASGSGTSTLTFTYTIASPHTSTDLDANSLGLNGGTINDAAGNAATLTLAGTSLATNKNIVVDTTVPSAPASIALDAADDTGTSNSDGVTKNTTNLTFTGTSEANATVRLYYPNTAGTLIGTTTANGSGNWTLDNISLAENTYSIVATATDAANNVSAASSAYSLNIDTTAPTNQNTVYASSSSRTSGGAQAIVSSGTASNQVWFAPSGTTTFAAGATMTQAGSGTATTINAPTTAGSYKLFVIDLAGNISSESTATLTVDNTAPSGYTVVIDQSYINNANKAAVSFTFTGAEVGATYNYTISSSGGGTNVTGSATVSSAGQQITGINTTGLGDGTLTLSVTLTDPAGNVGTAATNNKTKDVVAPVISATSPASSAGVTSSAANVTFSEDCASATIVWQSTGGTGHPNGPHTRTLTGSELNAGAHSNVAFGSNPLTGGGIYTVTWSCTDAAGNAATAVNATSVTYSSGPPAITSAVALDTNYNGKIDTYQVTFNKNIQDNTFPGYSANALGTVTTQWLVAGYSNVRLIHGTSVTFATDTGDDSVIYVRFDENVLSCNASTQTGCDTDAKPDLTTTATPGVTDGVQSLAQVNVGTVTEADNAAPVVVRALSLGASSLDVTFSEPITATQANVAGNYTLTGGVTVSNAARDATNFRIVHLTTSAQTGGASYTLTVNTTLRDLVNINLITNTNPTTSLPANQAQFNGVVDPVVVSIVTTSATTLTITFNESVKATTAECANQTACAVIYQNLSLPVLSAVSTGGAGVNSATYTLTVNPMIEGQAYTTTVLATKIEGVAAPAGRYVSSPNNAATFNGDGRPALTISTDTATECPTPTNLPPSIAARRRIVVQYDQTVGASATTAANYTVSTSPNGGCITGPCTAGLGQAASNVYSMGGNKYAVDWGTAFTQTTGTDNVYRLSVANVQDANGNAVATPTNVSFQCGVEATPPSLVSVTVVSSTSAAIVVLATFSEGVDNVTANTATNYRYDAQAYGFNVSSAARQANQAQVLITFAPGTALANGGHQLRVINVKDQVTPTGNAIADDGVGNVQPFLVNTPTGFSGGPIFDDPFGDGTPAGQIVRYNNKLLLGWDNCSSRLFEMNNGLTTAQTIAIDVDGNNTTPYTQLSGYTTHPTCTGTNNGWASTGGANATDGGSGAIAGIDAIAAACGKTATSTGNWKPSLTGAACTAENGIEYLLMGGYKATAPGFYKSYFTTTETSDTTTHFTFNHRVHTSNTTHTYRSMTMVMFTDWLYIASPHQGQNAPQVARICMNSNGCNDGAARTQWTAVIAGGGGATNFYPMIGKGGANSTGSSPNSGFEGTAGNTVSIDVMHEYDNDGGSANVPQLYMANGGRFGGTIGFGTGTTRLNRANGANALGTDGGIIRSRLARSTAAAPPGCHALNHGTATNAANCLSVAFENITPTSANWLDYMSIPLPFRSDANVDWGDMLPSNRIIPAIKAVPYMRTAPNGDLYMIRNACATHMMQTKCSATTNTPCSASAAGDAALNTRVNNNFNNTFSTTGDGRKQVCPPGYEVPQLWVLPAKGAAGTNGGGDGGNNDSDDWKLVASSSFTPVSYQSAPYNIAGAPASLPQRVSTTLRGNTATCVNAGTNRCERNAHLTLLEFVGNYLYIGFDNQDHGANVWRVDMAGGTCTGAASCMTSGNVPAETSFQIVNSVLGLDGSSVNQRIFSHVTVTDGGNDWLILVTRDGSNAMKIYRTANGQN